MKSFLLQEIKNWASGKKANLIQYTLISLLRARTNLPFFKGSVPFVHRCIA